MSLLTRTIARRLMNLRRDATTFLTFFHVRQIIKVLMETLVSRTGQ